RTFDYIVAVAQAGHVGEPILIAPDIIIRVAANETIVLGDDPSNSSTAVAPRYCPPLAVPVWTVNNVVAVPQGGHNTHMIFRFATDQTVGGRDHADRGAVAISPRHRPAIAVPIRT